MESASQPKPPVLREAHLRDYWKIVWQGRWTLLAVFVVVVGVTALWTFLQSPLYRAVAIVEIQPKARSLMAGHDVSGLGAAGLGWVAEERYQNTQIEIIKSRDITRRVVRLLNLESHPRMAGHSDPVDALRAMISVVPRRDTDLLEIGVSGPSPQEAAQWANAVAQAYVDRNYEKARQNITQSVGAVREQLEDLSRQLEAVEDERIQILASTRIYNPENSREMVREELLDYTKKLTDAKIEERQLESLLRQVADMRAEGASLLSLPEFARDENMQQLMRKKVEVEQELSRLGRGVRPGHPEYDAASRSLNAITGEIDRHIDLVVAGLERRLAETRDRGGALREEKTGTELASIKIAQAAADIDSIDIHADTLRQLRDVLLRMMEEIQVSADLLNNNIDILDEAIVPRGPIKPRKQVNLAMGAMLGMFLGLASVFFLDYLDNTIRTPEDVEKYLGASVLGVVPKMDDGGIGQRAVREAYQSLRTSIIFSSKNRQHRVLLITSTGPREGKSSTVANLGRTLATAGDRVIVVDCDLRKPKQHVHHDLPREPGLTNYLAGERDDRDWSRFVRPSQPNLDVLTCGPIPPSPPELLGNERFSELLQSLRGRYDWVLLDSPPAANLADATVLASMAELVVLVVRHNSTDRDHVIKTFHQLRAVNPAVAGVVLNSVDLGRAYHKDYYYAGYYYEEEPEASGRSRAEREAQVG